MSWNKILYPNDSEPLTHLVEGYSHTSIFRRIAFIGDSLSSGEFESRTDDGQPTYHDFFEYSWGQFLARKNGLTAFNFSRGGMSAKEYIESYAEEQGWWDPDKACQAYVIALGANDLFNFRMEVGSVEDIHPTDPSLNKPTYAGYYAAIIQRYKAIQPDAHFFFVTFPKTDDPIEQEYCAAIHKLLYDFQAYFDNSYVIDLYTYAPTIDQTFRDTYYLYGHMTPAGYLLGAKLIDSYIDYIIRHNPRDFDITGFIGTDIAYRKP